MHFQLVHGPSWPRVVDPNSCLLRRDHWDDFGFKTLFQVLVTDSTGYRFELGEVKITSWNLEEGYVQIPPEFDRLPETYCSLGQDQNYYEQIYALPEGLGMQLVENLRDCVAFPEIWERFRDQPSVSTSLLRSVPLQAVEVKFPKILIGQSELSEYHFEFANVELQIKVDFHVTPHQFPPTNVQTIIGRNGVGKTRLLTGIVNALTGARDSTEGPLTGSVSFPDPYQDYGSFANLIAVSFSALDYFIPYNDTTKSGSVKYTYVGLKSSPAAIDDNVTISIPVDSPIKADDIQLKTLATLSQEFTDSLNQCLMPGRIKRWKDIVQILESDPGFAELQLSKLGTETSQVLKITEQFRRLSSGHKLVLLTIARLVELVDERTIVLIDEPESHLHPPLLSAFVRALSSLLILRNGVAIIATHSPVVLQEVPRLSTWIMRRNGPFISFDRPSLETFGEGVGTLTHEVFQLEVQQSGFYTLIEQLAESFTYEEILELFNNQLGGEARAYARILAKEAN